LSVRILLRGLQKDGGLSESTHTPYPKTPDFPLPIDSIGRAVRIWFIIPEKPS